MTSAERCRGNQPELLLKDVGLLLGEVGSLPAGDLGQDVEWEILQARALLGAAPAAG